MRKLLYIALLINLLLVPFQYVKAEDFADANDIFKVISPTPNSKVGGTINIEWNSFDDDQTSIPYYIQLLDGSTCKTSSYGRINTNSAAISSTLNNNKISWDTHKTISNQSLADGSYCLQICSAFKKDDAYYSICNSRNITIVNVNKLPTISSTPKNLTINENEPWQYQVNASDVDSDKLKYYLVFAPDFLSIDSNTGLLTTKANASRISDSDAVAEYRVVIGVDDGISGTTTQEFTIRIEKGRAANPTDTNNNNNGSGNNNGGTQTPQNVTSQISFTAPKENDELKGIQNFIQWSIYDPDGIKEVTLSYSKNLENWTELVTKQEDNFSRYSWDVSSIEDGKYYLQLKVKDKKDEVVAKTSKPFIIKNTETNTVENKPLIINVKPENLKSITESPTTITGDFAPAQNQQIDPDTFKLTLNEKDLTQDCVKNQSGFQCTVKEKLSEGGYKITAEIKDLNGNQGNFESSFNLKPDTEVNNNSTGSSANSNSLVIIIIVILLFVILVGLPWLFIGYTKRKSKQKAVQTTSINPIAPTNYAYPQAAVTINNQPAFTAPQQNNTAPTDQSKSFSDFMSNYSFNTQPVEAPKQENRVQQSVVTVNKKIGEVKPQKVQEPKQSIGDTFKNLKNKVSSFIPKPETPVGVKPAPSAPVKVNDNPALSQNIQMAYSGGTTANKTSEPQQPEFVEPTVIDQEVTTSITANNYVEPATSDEDLKNIYPELYGQSQPVQAPQNPVTGNTSPSEDYFEPTPKD